MTIPRIVIFYVLSLIFVHVSIVVVMDVIFSLWLATDTSVVCARNLISVRLVFELENTDTNLLRLKNHVRYKIPT